MKDALPIPQGTEHYHQGQEVKTKRMPYKPCENNSSLPLASPYTHFSIIASPFNLI